MIRRFLIIVALGYALLTLLLTLGWQFAAGTSWLLAMANIFALYLFLPLIPLLLLGFWLRSRPYWLALALPLVLFALQFGRLALPSTVEATQPQLRVMTLNLLTSNRRFDELAAFVRTQNPDVLAVQELHPRMVDALNERLATSYPYHVSYPSNSWDGLGVWSRYPITASRPPEGLRFMEATLSVAGRPIQLINAHPRAPRMAIRNYRRLPIPLPQTFSTRERDGILAVLATRIDAAPRPLILAGDLNLSERELPYQLLAARLDDAFRQASWGFGNTFPANRDEGDGYRLRLPFPVVRIDYIWSSAELPAHFVDVRCDVPGSDHCAVVADLGLR